MTEQPDPTTNGHVSDLKQWVMDALVEVDTFRNQLRDRLEALRLAESADVAQRVDRFQQNADDQGTLTTRDLETHL